MKQAIILRGIPGSGKSTFAQRMKSCAPHPVHIHSTDEFFLVSGIYRFDPKRLHTYHEKNFCAFTDSLYNEIPIVILDNTNIRRYEYRRYEEEAIDLGYAVKIIAMPHPSIDEAARRNVHKIPNWKIAQILARWEPDPREETWVNGSIFKEASPCV